MVAEENDDGVVQQSALLQLSHHPAHQVIGHSDAGVVDSEVLIGDALGAVTLGALDLVDDER